MNQTFKVGEVAIIHGITRKDFIYLNETECIICDDYKNRWVGTEKGKIKQSDCYSVTVDGEKIFGCKAQNLRKKPPKSGSKEWAESKVKELIKPLVMA